MIFIIFYIDYYHKLTRPKSCFYWVAAFCFALINENNMKHITKFNLLLTLLLVFSIGLFGGSEIKNAGTVGVSGSTSGTAGTWQNTSNALGNTATFTHTAFGVAPNAAGGKTGTSEMIRFTNFGFTVGTTSLLGALARIDGIIVIVTQESSKTGGDNGPSRIGEKGNTVRLVKGGTVVGDNRAIDGREWPRGTKQDVYYGGVNDKWGTAWTAADIDDTDFGVELDVSKLAPPKVSGEARIYRVQILVYFDETVYYSKSTVSTNGFNVITEWGLNPDGSGANPANFTDNGQVFVVTNSATHTLDADWTVSGTGSRVVLADPITTGGHFGAATSLIVPNGRKIVGQIDIDNGGTLDWRSGDNPFLGTIHSYYVLSGTSKVIFSHTGNQNVPRPLSGGYHELELGGSGIKTLLGQMDVVDNLTIISGVTFAGQNFPFSAAKDVINNGTHSNTSDEGAIILTGARMAIGVTQKISGNGTFGNVKVFFQDGTQQQGSSNVTISGSLYIESGCFHQIGTNFLSIGGAIDFVNTGCIKGSNTSDLRLVGSAGRDNLDSLKFGPAAADQVIQSFTMNRTKKVILASPLEVTNSGTATFTNGILESFTSTMFKVSENSSISGGSASSHVVGPMSRFIAATGTQTRLFPIGDGTEYLPVTLEMVQSATTNTEYVVELKNESAMALANTLPGTLARVSFIRYFDINKIGGSAITSGFVTLTYSANDIVNKGSELRIAKTDGANWMDLGGTGTGDNSGTIKSTNSFTTFSSFSLASSNAAFNPLPVSLTSYNGVVKQDGNLLSWTTVSEVNNKGFVIERTEDGVNWIEIGFVSGAINSFTKNNYSLFDANAPNYSLYRLVQYDIDNTRENLGIVELIRNNEIKGFDIIPNSIFQGEMIKVNIPHAENETEHRLKIININGQIIDNTSFKGSEYVLNTQHLVPGLYFVYIETNGRTLMNKILIY